MRCQQCSNEAFLFRGLCKKCAPDLHADNNRIADVVERASQRFKQMTGKEPLSDWYTFEPYVEEEYQRDTQVQQALIRLYAD